MKDVMVDIECFATSGTPVIVQVGACYFNRHTGEIGDEFKVNISPVDAQKYGGTLDAGTVSWWMEQSEAARNSILAKPQEPIKSALARFRQFIAPAKAVWSHATFDFVILNNVCSQLGLGKMRYGKARDIRTLVDLAQIEYKKVERDGLHHDALEDCKFQVKYCVLCFNALKR